VISTTNRLKRIQQLQRRLEALQPTTTTPPPTLTFKVHGTDQVLQWVPQAQGTAYSLQLSDPVGVGNAISLLPHQAAFLTDRSTSELLLCGGFGSGKSRALALRSVLLAAEQPGSIGLICSPTYRMAIDVMVPILHDTLAQLGINYQAVKHPMPAFLLPQFNSQLLIRSGDNPDRLRGLSVHHVAVDELDTIDSAHARDLWAILVSRCREGSFQTLYSSSTPEGFNHCYQHWVEQAADHKRLIKARTADNPFLPAGYIDALKGLYNPEQLRSYLDGEFTALAQGRVYPSFDRMLNSSSAAVRHGDKLLCGMDFNVGQTNLCIAVRRPDGLHIVDEVAGVYDTEAAVKVLQSRYPFHCRERQVIIHPDASGGSRHTNSTTTDLQLLRQAGLKVDAPSSNPPIRDTLNVVNAALLNGRGERSLFIHPRCSQVIRSLEQQTYDDHGTPDKGSGLDHMADCVRYLCWRSLNFGHKGIGKAVGGIKLY
jgi:PBSX family phage terminase large subunit